MRSFHPCDLACVAPLLLVADPAVSAARAEGRPWTFMIYGTADNDNDGPIFDLVRQVREGLDDDPGMEVVLFIDRSSAHSDDATALGEDFEDARIYRLRRDSVTLLDASSHFPEMGTRRSFEADCADPETLGRFVAYCKEAFPARRHALMIYGHANGYAMCWDDAQNTHMFVPELGKTLSSAASVDFLALEACTMAGVEVAYEWRPERGGFTADVLLAIPTSGPPLDWGPVFSRIRSPGRASPAERATLDPARATAADLAALVVEEGPRSRARRMRDEPELARMYRYEAASALDLTVVDEVKRSVDALARALAPHDDARELVLELFTADPPDVLLNFIDDDLAQFPFVDLFDLAARIELCEDLPADARAAAGRTRETVDRFVLGSFGMADQEEFLPGRNGTTLVLLAPGRAPSGIPTRAAPWERFWWYRPAAPSLGLEHRLEWTFLTDGATPDNGEVETWFELLDLWFDDAAEDPGGVNGYVY